MIGEPTDLCPECSNGDLRNGRFPYRDPLPITQGRRQLDTPSELDGRYVADQSLLRQSSGRPGRLTDSLGSVLRRPEHGAIH